ncbi:hypothetical protein [Virgibacillus litoralis]|uniref:Uncharacterized protein n=1 Tax=Virgibacillus litoralis TaxID=578221 RepID=A0ABS4HIE8_9BACI|nr:hypothetical protein [Virgibacillus litoralis]MBP1950695.1 hypothetical protein [Virgibacillus litoralis]
MFRKKDNPFDRGLPNESNKIEIIIQSQFFNDFIEEYETEITRLFYLSRLPFINLILLPLNNVNNNFRNILEQHNFSIPIYEKKQVNGNKIIFSTKDYELVVLNGELDCWKDKMFESGQISVPDMQTINHLVPDYFIMDKQDPYLKRKDGNIRKVGIQQFFDEVRILLVHHQIFYSHFNHLIKGQMVYNNYRLMSKFTKAFELGFYYKKVSEETSVLKQNYSTSLTNRLYLLCKSVDEIEFYSYKTPNNDTKDEALYHLGYYIMLLTGSFENIAGVIKGLHNVELKHHKELSIRVYNHKENNPLLIRVIQKNPELVRYLLDNKVKTFINLVYEIRDTLQHRDYIQGMGSSSPNGKNPNLLWIPEENAESFERLDGEFQKKLSFDGKLEGGYLFNMHQFTKRLFEFSVEMVNDIMHLINIYLHKELSLTDKSIVEKRIDEFRQGNSYIMRIGKDSLYFN